MQKGWTGNYFEDFALGSAITCPIPRTITAGDVAAYIALTGDRTPAYCGPLGAVHPLVTFHVVFGQTVRTISLNARANLGYAEVRWHQRVSIGDTLSTAIKIVGLKENSSRKTGIVWVQTEGRNQRGELVLSFTRWVMIKKRGDGDTPWLAKPVVPDLPTEIDSRSLWFDDELVPTSEAAGARWAFADYAAGERVHHFDAMVVNPSDHMSLTRLAQNSAKVHFDAHGMDGRPLVYGGVVISHAYALAFNGFERRLGLAGLNGGSHCNPTYAGDTLYAWTDVLQTVALSDQVGAVRVRLVAVKNHNPAVEELPLKVEDPSRPGRLRHHANVVLELDLWEMVGR